MTIFPVPKPSKREPKKIRMGGCSKRSKKSAGHAFPKLVSTGRRAWIRKQACIATGRRNGEIVTAQDWMPDTLKSLCPYRARVIVAHVKSRGSGGADAGNTVPLEWWVHELVGQKGWKWLEKKCRLMPVTEIAGDLEAKYLAKQVAIARNMEKQ